MEDVQVTSDREFDEFVDRCHAALHLHTGGNPQPFLDLWSQADDVTLMGGVGGWQVGISEVSDLLRAAARTLNYETWSAQSIFRGISGDLGVTVELENLTRTMNGASESMGLRATSVYRMEDGEWKVIHRHGDGQMEVKIDPEGRR